MLPVQAPLLVGSHVQVEPLVSAHQEELYEAAQDKRIWTYSGSRAFGEQFQQWFEKALQEMSEKKQLCFVVRRIQDQRLIGSSRYYDLSPEHLRLSIGYTWYVPAVWGTAVNPECKFLLLEYAFERMLANRVEFTTDSHNLHSQSALKKLGANRDGVLRFHMILKDGYIRDSVLFSIVKPDWPEVKAGLLRRLQGLSC